MNNHPCNTHSSVGSHLLRTQSTTNVTLLPQFRGTICPCSLSLNPISAILNRNHKPLGGSSPIKTISQLIQKKLKFKLTQNATEKEDIKSLPILGTQFSLR
jgi:hypothetical protein